MNLTIDPHIFDRFPQSMTGVIFAHGLNNSVIVPVEDLRPVEDLVRAAFAGLEAPSRHPNILSWRQAFKAFECDPQKYRCSAEALARQVLKGNSIWGINPLVDIYNFISLKYIVPVGGENLSAIVGDVQLTFATGTEEFIRLGSTENDPPEPGEVIYKDDTGVLCRRWNWREAERTKLIPQTTDAIIVLDAMPPMAYADVERATQELAELIKHYCGGTTECSVRVA
jgi:DNA/RNA-binding domain of Phe-tRNA-synthetase-like protein